MRKNHRLSNTCLVIFLLLTYGIVMPAISQDYNALRMNMVKDQLEKRGIQSKRVLAAMRKVERHLFVPKNFAKAAYTDQPLPIGEGQTISQPYIVAFMTEALNIKPTDRILEVGTGSGYQAAILAELCAEVYTIEIIESLGARADSLLKALNYKNISVRLGDGYKGWPEAAPFDAIIVTCSPSHVPKPLEEQLKEGGRMIIPVGVNYTQELVLLVKKKDKLVKEKSIPVLFVPMRDSGGKKY
jgi:protein-L-isoaspartate(D-aspartate) O-methyltransferase